jgi:large subunit ribosomal protein L24
MLKLKLHDKVKVLSGKDKGREGEIEGITPKKGTLIVPGVNMYKKHVKGSQGQKGGIYDIPRAMKFGKVGLICPKCKALTRVGFRMAGEEKVRICKKCQKEIDTK